MRQIAVLALLPLTLFGQVLMGGASSLGGKVVLGGGSSTPAPTMQQKPSTLTSGLILNWPDSSGNGYDLTGGGTAPTVLTVGGVKTAYYGPSAFKYLTIPAGLTIDMQNVAVFLVGYRAQESISDFNSPEQTFVAFGASTTGSYFRSAWDAAAVTAQPGIYPSSTAPFTLSWGLAIHGFVSRPTGLTVFQEGNSATLSALSSLSLSGGTLGTNTTGTLIGAVAEFRVYSPAPNPAAVNAIIAELGSTYTIGAGVRQKLLVFDGDSITEGFSTDELGDYAHLVSAELGTSWQVDNTGEQSVFLSTLRSSAAARIDPLYDAARTKNIVSIFAGTNDIANGASAAASYAELLAYCQDRIAVGWQVVVWTMLPRGTDPAFETSRQTFNSLVKGGTLAGLGVVIADAGADATIGEPGDQDNTMYYSDKIHPVNAGHSVLYSLFMAAAAGIL